MRIARLSVLSILVVSMFAACGGDDGGGGGGVDAPKVIDAPMIDAPAALMGLGQRCVPSMGGADCPTTVPVCLSMGAGAAVGFCSALCVDGGAGMTDAMGALQLTAITPAPNTAACTSAYMGGAMGTPACNALLATTPAHNPLMASTNYTAIRIACIVRCGTGNTCPTGLSCNTTAMACLP